MYALKTFRHFGKSDIGKVRKNNEDVFAMLPEHGFFALADGMGGHNGGEIAAHETISYLCRSFQEHFLATDDPASPAKLERRLHKAIEECNKYVHHVGKKNVTLKGMGTTICTALITEMTLIYCHIGDSRLYCLRRDTLTQLTKDHSLINKIVDEENVTESEARESVSPSIITRSVGTHPNVPIEISQFALEGGDKILLCTDGLTDLTSNEEIQEILKKDSPLENLTESLIDVAISHGGSDNITVILVEIDEEINIP